MVQGGEDPVIADATEYRKVQAKDVRNSCAIRVGKDQRVFTAENEIILTVYIQQNKEHRSYRHYQQATTCHADHKANETGNKNPVTVVRAEINVQPIVKQIRNA